MRTVPGSAEFYADYARLRNGGSPAPKQAVRSGATPKTWQWVCERYFEDMAFKSLATDGQRLRRRLLEATFVEPVEPGSSRLFGDFPLEFFDSRAVCVLRDRKVKMISDGSTGEVISNLNAANSRLKYIRAVLKFATRQYREIVPRNWAVDVEYFRVASEGHPAWTLDEIAQFEQHYPVGSKARLTMALGLYAGQRRGDIARLGRVFERDGFLQFMQEKNHRKKPVEAYVPIVPPLRSIIDATETGDLSTS